MAESSIFWTTGAGGDGANPYTDTQLFSWLRRTMTGDEYAARAILRGYNNELIVTGGTGQVTVGTGAAYVYGIPYENDATVNVAISTPLTATRIDRIVLRAKWADKTVRITRIEGTEGGGAPAITQTPGTIYDVPLASVQVTTGGAITVTDERSYCHFATEITTENIADTAVTKAKIASLAVSTSRIADGAVTTDKLADLAVATTKIANGAVTPAKLSGDALAGAWMKGQITMWSGTLSGHYPIDPASGQPNQHWHICNGDTENGVVTPNLADKFVIAQGATYTKGNTGGSATLNWSHSHSVSVTVNSVSGHTHSLPEDTGFIHGFTLGNGPVKIDGAGADDHTHHLGGDTGSGGGHSHTTNNSSGSAGSTSSIIPPYYCLIYICYVG